MMPLPKVSMKILIAPLFLLAGCATTLTPGGEAVRTISQQQAEKCERLKLVTASARTGMDKPGNAMKEAMNLAAAAGGDAFVVTSASNDVLSGASVTGEAYKCK